VRGGPADLRADQGPRRAAGRGAGLKASPLPPGIAAVVLDFDGLIVDTETPIFEAWLAAYRRRGQSVGLGEWQHALGTHGGFDPLDHLDTLLAGSLALQPGQALDREAVLAEVKEATAKGCEGQPLLPGVEALLRDAKALGLGRAVASSSSCGWVNGWLERHGIRDLLDVVVARDDVRKVKPDPELFLLAAARLGVEPAACVVFEDSPNGMRAALAAGMRCVAVPNALTRPLARPDVDLVLDSLAERPLGSILEALAVPGTRPAPRGRR
jgi:HAD superfamily hydrolase (TIGR01509 family)